MCLSDNLRDSERHYFLKIARSLVVLLLVANTGTAQTADTETVLARILSIKDRAVRMQALYNTCTIRYTDNPVKAKVFAIAFNRENEQQPIDSNTAKANYLLGDVALINGRYKEALQYSLKALKLAEQEKMYQLQTEILSDISGVYLRTDDLDKSLLKIQEGLAIARAHHLPVNEARLMDFLGVRYAMLDRHDEANKVYDSALVKARLLRLPKLELGILENKAIGYRVTGQHQLALNTLKRTLSVADSIGGKNRKATLFLHISQVYATMNRLDEAEDATDKALALSGDIADPQFTISLYDNLSKIKAKKSDFRSALDLKIRQMNLQDSFFNMEKAAQIQELQTRYDTEVKDNQLATQSVQISANRKVNLFLWFSLGLLFIIGAVIFLNQRKTKRLYLQIFRQSQALTHKSNELERLNTVKDRLFSTISHDMRAPVHSLLSFTTLLDQGEIPPHKLAIYAAELKTSLGFTATLMENLLNFARSQMGGYQAKLEPINLRAITTDAVSLAQGAAQQKSIVIQQTIDDQLKAMADGNMLALIMRNLLGNAIKFTHTNGLITMTAHRIDDNMVCWQISDNGVGIEKELVVAFNETADKGNQPLEHTPGTNNEKGTGLGLMLSKTFLTLMDGKILLESEVGEGSRFSIYLRASN